MRSDEVPAGRRAFMTAAVLLALAAAAAAADPQLRSIAPWGAQRGTEVEVTLRGAWLGERREGDDLVRRMIGTLPERQQIALVLRHLEEMSYRQIAETMDISESTARVQVRNAREALRRAILKRDPIWAADAET